MMTKLTDPYAELGLDKDINGDATEGELAAAYRKVAKEVHPDVNNSPEASADFDRATKALALLKDPLRRRRFHQTGEVDEDKPIDATRAAALGLIDNFIEQEIAAYANSNFETIHDPRLRDLVKEFSGDMGIQISNAAVSIRQWEKTKRFLEDMAKRWTSTDPENPVRRAIERKVRRCDADIANLKEATEARRKAIEIMAAHKFDWDQPTREINKWLIIDPRTGRPV